MSMFLLNHEKVYLKAVQKRQWKKSSFSSKCKQWSIKENNDQWYRQANLYMHDTVVHTFQGDVII